MSAVTPEQLAPAVVPWSERIYQRTLTIALFTLGFFLLFSTAGISVAMGVLLLLCFMPQARVWQAKPWREPVLAVGLVLLAYVAVRSFAAAGFTRETASAVNHYHELLMLPLLWVLMRSARRPQAFVNGLMLGAVLFASAHWLAPYDARLEWWLHTRRISGGFALAACAFLLFEHARLGKLPAWFGYGLAAYFAATVVFASAGRTGHLTLLLLLLCISFRAAPRRLRLGAMLATLVCGLLIAYASNPVRARLVETWQEVQHSQTGARGAPWSRTELLRTGAVVAERNLPLGTGWEAYPRVFSAVAVERLGSALQENGSSVSVNPHNEYMMQLGAGGIPALLLYLAWLGVPMWRAVRERRSDRPWAGAVGCLALAFAAGSLFNSVLLDFVEGHFYAAVLAWLLVRRVQD